MKDSNNPFDKNLQRVEDDSNRWDHLFNDIGDSDEQGEGGGEVGDGGNRTIRLNGGKKRNRKSRCCSGRNTFV